HNPVKTLYTSKEQVSDIKIIKGFSPKEYCGSSSTFAISTASRRLSSRQSPWSSERCANRATEMDFDSLGGMAY
ncbi:hypothetical protein, partial [Isoptericola croceus]|uniref:hypothetical protein n=1 Tax=Isoptericola croceus TaxID=3031406 RepID=UPI0023F9951F